MKLVGDQNPSRALRDAAVDAVVEDVLAHVCILPGVYSTAVMRSHLP